MQHRSTSDHEAANGAQSSTDAKSATREGGHAVLERIARSEALPASLSASEAFESVIGVLVQRLPAEHAADLVDRRLPKELGALLERDAEEALENGAESDLEDYLDEVAGRLELDSAPVRELVDAVVGALRLVMSAEEVDAIAAALSPQLAAVWLRACNVPGAPSRSGQP